MREKFRVSSLLPPSATPPPIFPPPFSSPVAAVFSGFPAPAGKYYSKLPARVVFNYNLLRFIARLSSQIYFGFRSHFELSFTEFRLISKLIVSVSPFYL